MFHNKLHELRGGQIVGGGWFMKYEAMPIHWTWDAIGEENGAATFDEMVARIGKYRRTKIDIPADPVGCPVLVQPFSLRSLSGLSHQRTGRRTSFRAGATTET